MLLLYVGRPTVLFFRVQSTIEPIRERKIKIYNPGDWQIWIEKNSSYISIETDLWKKFQYPGVMQKDSKDSKDSKDEFQYSFFGKSTVSSAVLKNVQRFHV